MENRRIRIQIIEGILKYLLKEIEMYVREKPVIYPHEFTIAGHFL